ncbi:MAG: MFS transporter [Spirochaetota bacterium]
MDKKILTATSLGHALTHISMLVLPAVLVPVSQEYDLSLTRVTGIGTVAYLLFGVGALPAGIVGRLTSAKFLLILYFIGTAISGLLVGIAPTFAAFVIGMGLLGLSSSIYHVAGPTLISHFSGRTGKAFGVHGVAGSAGITLAPLIAGVLASFVSWRAAYLALIVPALVGGALLLLDREIPYAHATGNPHAAEQSGTARRITFVLLLLVMTVNGFVYRAFLTMFPTYISQSIPIGEISPVLSGGVLASIILAFGMVGQYIGGAVADRMDRFRLYAMLLVAAVPLLLLVGLTTQWILLGVAVVFSLFYFPLQPVENSILGTYVPPKLVSSVFGAKFILTFGVGSLGAVFSGYIAESLNTSAVYLLLAPITLVSVVLALFAIHTRRRAALEPAARSNYPDTIEAGAADSPDTTEHPTSPDYTEASTRS